MAISDRITSIEEHIKESYQELEGLGIDTTGVNNNLENIPKLLDGYWETLPKVTEEGTSITLDNTKEGKMKVLLKGNTYQETTTGKNLLNLRNGTRTHNGLTGTYENGVLTYSGTATSNYATLTTGSSNALQAGTYTFSTEQTMNFQLRLRFNLEDSSQYNVNISVGGGTSTTFTLEQPAQSYYVFLNNLTSGNTYSGTIKMQLESGSSATSFEPYTNGTSPNPDYPQDIHTVNGDNEIAICGENLLDTSSMVMGDLQNNTGAEIANTNHTHYRSGFIKVLPNTRYTFTTNYTYPSNSITKLMEYGEDKSFIQRSSASSPNKIIPFNTSSTTHYLRVCMYSYVAFTDFYSLENMLKKGTDTTYEEYTGATYPINLGVENLWKPIPSATKNGVTLTYNDDGSYTLNGTSTANTSFYTTVNYPTGTYSFSVNNSQTISGGADYLLLETSGGTSTNKTLTLSVADNKATYDITSPIVAVVIVISSGKTYNNFVIKPQLEKGSKVNSFSKYGTTPIEMCNIPNTNYKDTFVHEDNKWYKYAMVGKVVLNGSETWSFTSNGNAWYISGWATPNNAKLPPSNNDISNSLSNNFTNVARNNIGNVSQGFGIATSGALNMKHPDYSTGITGTPQETQAWKTWLSNNNTIVYYVLATPTYTKIEGELLSQLNALAKSYASQTNISQENNDLASILNATALEEME